MPPKKSPAKSTTANKAPKQNIKKVTTTKASPANVKSPGKFIPFRMNRMHDYKRNTFYSNFYSGILCTSVNRIGTTW